jgi:hypothetical protein
MPNGRPSCTTTAEQASSHVALTLNDACLLLPELAMQVGSYLDPLDLRVCTTQLCSGGAEFVSAGFTNDATIILLHELVARCRLSVGGDDVAQECIERIESFVARRGNVRTIALDAQLRHDHATNASIYSDIHHCLQQDSSFHLSQSQGITVQWHVIAESIARVEFLLNVDVPKDGARVSHARAGGAVRQCLHTLNLRFTQVGDVPVLASCQYLHTLNLQATNVTNVSPLASCQSLHTLDLSHTLVSDVYVLGSCQSLHTLILDSTLVSYVSSLASCQSLHTLDLRYAPVSDVSALASCRSLHTLILLRTQASDVSALASCQSLHTLNLRDTQVSDVSALASCQSLHTLDLTFSKVCDVSALASCQSLSNLVLMGTAVSDVSALVSCQSLHRLALNTTRVSDVSALASCLSLRELLGADGMIGCTAVLRIIEDRR